jgi:hypothetical protein
LPWFYSELESIEEVTYTAPSKPQKQWTSVENRQWLMAHGIPCRNLRAKELQLLVSTKIIDATIQIVPPAGGTVEQVLDVFLSLIVMTCDVMNRVATPCTIKSLRRKIIVFLSCYDKFDVNMRGTDRSADCPGWVTSYNFRCLIDLPGTVAEFGPLRNLWEGWEGGGVKEKRFYA